MGNLLLIKNNFEQIQTLNIGVQRISLPLAIGILSWRAYGTIRNTLTTYVKSGLFQNASQVFIFFQEFSDEDIKISEEYSLEAYGIPKNIGIANGYKAMLHKVNQPYYLFLENDWIIYEDQFSFITEKLQQGIDLLQAEINFVKYRSRHFPGSPLWSRQWAGNELYHPEHLIDSLHWRTDASIHLNFSDKLKYENNGWYSAISKYANWTNNPHLAKTSWLRESIEPHLGNKDIEHDIQKWWQAQNYKVAQGDGLFTHFRIDR